MSTSPPPSSVGDPVERVIEIVGLSRLATALRVSPQAIRKWQKAGRLPRTEWTGETSYAATMAGLADGKVTEGELKGRWVPAEPQRAVGEAEHAA